MSRRTERPESIRQGLVVRSVFRRPLAEVAAHRECSAAQPAAIATLLALAHHLQAAIDQGVISDRSAVARALGMTTARVSQVMNLLLLAPDIQEELLELEAIGGVEPISEKRLREVAREREWSRQRARWAAGLGT